MALPIIPDPPATRIQGEDVSEIGEGTGQEKTIKQMDKRNPLEGPKHAGKKRNERRHSSLSQNAHLRIN